MTGLPEVPLRIAVAQIGARRHYAVPAIFERAGLLECLYTDLCANAFPVRHLGLTVPRFLRRGAMKRLLSRTIKDVPRNKIRCFARFALTRLWRKRRPMTPGQLRREHVRANRQFGCLVAQAGFGRANAVHLFNGAALEILRRAKQFSMQTVLEQTSAPVAVEEALLQDEHQRWPGWEFGEALPEDWQPMAERERDEWNLADTIICGSQFVRDGVRDQNGPAQRCVVVPYGMSSHFVEPKRERPRRSRLRVLFVGAIRLQKGIQYLYEAAKQLRKEDVEFRAVGPIRLEDAAAGELRSLLELTGPIPRSTIHRHYQWADVFVLPSISEGSAGVCYEALAAGLPVITTPNAGSVVRDGADGYIVPIRCAESLAQRIMTLASDRELLDRLSRSAGERAREFTWDHYARRLLAAVTTDSTLPQACP